VPNRQHNPALAGSARLMYIALFRLMRAAGGHSIVLHQSCAERWPKLGLDRQASLLYCVSLLPGGIDEVRAPEADLERGDASALPAGCTLPPSCSATRQPCGRLLPAMLMLSPQQQPGTARLNCSGWDAWGPAGHAQGSSGTKK